MEKIGGWAAAVLCSVAVAIAGCGKGEEKFRAQLDPVVARISERMAAAAGLASAAPAQVLERAGTLNTDLAGLGADLKGLYVDGDKQRSLVAAGQAYQSAAQRLVQAQQEFARARAKLAAANAKVKESLDAKVRTSKFSMDFWKESHDRFVSEADKVRKETAAGRDRLAAALSGAQQAVDAAGAVLGSAAVLKPGVIADQRKALEAVALD